MKNDDTKKQLLREPDIEPTNDILSLTLGGIYNTYMKFTDMLISCDVVLEWRYYNDGKAWLGKCLYKWKSSRGTDKEKTILWLSIWDSFFKTSFFFPEKVREELLNLPVSENTKIVIKRANPIGKLKFFPLILDVCSEDMFNDLLILINYHKSIK